MFDCLVIGAGLAGLAAGNELVRRGLNTMVLEARGRIGGRVENAELSDGEIVEMGGQWIGPGHEEMYELVSRYQLDLIDLPTEGEFTIRIQGRSLRVPSREGEPVMSPFEVADLGQGLMRFRRLGNRLNNDPDWVASNQNWLNQDLQLWVSTNLRTPGGQRCFLEVFEAAFDANQNITLEQGLKLITVGVDLEDFVAAKGGLRQSRVAGGIYAICEGLAKELGPRVRLSTPVTGLSFEKDHVRVQLASGEQLQARRVITTLPPRLAVKLDHNPPLPNWRAEIAEKVPPGNVIKAFLVYDRPWWRDLGLSGQMGADTGAVRVTLETSGVGKKRGMLLGFFEGSEAESFAENSEESRKQAFIDSVVQAFGESAANPVEYIERNWGSEPYTGGCHGAHFAPGVWTANGPQLAEPHGFEYFAGAEYSNKFNGYMEGAVRSAKEVAAVVARELIG